MEPFISFLLEALPLLTNGEIAHSIIYNPTLPTHHISTGNILVCHQIKWPIGSEHEAGAALWSELPPGACRVDAGCG